MQSFVIHQPDEAIKALLEDKINHFAKPLGSLGVLEELAIQLGWIQQQVTPMLTQPHHLLFAADHGIEREGVSPSPRDITWQQALNFVNGGGGINIFIRQHEFTLLVIDAGVDHTFLADSGVIDRKIRYGTRNFLHEAAMTEQEMEQALTFGAEMVDHCYQQGCNIVSLGELGIANTSASSIWMSYLTNISLKECVGAGSGWASNGIIKKYHCLQQAINNYQGERSALAIMRYFGGYEMVMTVGAMLRAAELKMIILIDGFIMTNCLLMAAQFHPNVMHYAVFGHQGDEVGHRLLLAHLGKQGLLQMKFRLGEGTGAVCAYPLLVSAANMLNEMKSFAEAGVTPITLC